MLIEQQNIFQSETRKVKKKSGMVEARANRQDEEEGRKSYLPGGLKQCRSCNRKFAPDRLETHQKICRDNIGRKRKVFNMSKARVEGTDAAGFVGVRTHTKKVGVMTFINDRDENND